MRVMQENRPQPVHPDGEGGPGGGERPGIRKILLPTDFSAAATAAVWRAVMLGCQCQAALTLMHVVNINAQPRSGELVCGPLLMKQLWIEGAERLERLAAVLDGQLDLQTLLVEGLPWEAIVLLSVGFDLLILGRSLHQRRREWFSHHTGRRVLKQARCPVMIVPG